MRLRPGVHVLRRDPATVQVGLDPPARVLLPRDPEVTALLRDLADGPPPDPPAPGSPAGRALGQLVAAGLVEGGPPMRRTPAPLAVDDPDGLLPDLDAAAVPAHVAAHPSGAGGRALHVVARAAPVGRGLLDHLVADSTPHLVVGGTGTPGVVRVGPYVDPGRTACTRCVDAHESLADPRRPFLLEQLAGRPGAPMSALLRRRVAALVAAQVAALRAGVRPAVWSATVDLHDAAPGALPEACRWTRHPECGCAWDELMETG